MRVKIEFDGSGLMFAPGIEFIEALKKAKHRLPNFHKWAKRRARHHQELRRFTKTGNRRELVRRLIYFYRENVTSGSSGGADVDRREWFLGNIVRVSVSIEEFWLANILVQKAMPEMIVLPAEGEEEKDMKFDSFFVQALAGCFLPEWPFSKFIQPGQFPTRTN